MIFAFFLFVISAGLLVYSYILYPWLLKLLASGKKENSEVFSIQDADLPVIQIFFSAYNEERVINEKMESLLNTRYPAEKVRIFIGSDNSNDKTDEIIGSYAIRDSRIHFRKFSGRNGKSNILNALVAEASKDETTWQQSVLVLTDANVMFTPGTLYGMVRHFKNPRIGQVGANILNRGIKKDGISFQEKSYIQRENKIKYHEGLIWGTMMGAFGACHAIRPQCWKTIPANFLMEDFYLSMNVLDSGFKAIKDLSAVCYEDVSNEIEQELKRKTRIQAGNFQNLKTYFHLLFKFNAVSFCFFSHKVIRWFGPLLILLALVSNYALSDRHPILQAAFFLQCFLLLTPLSDWILRKAGVHIKPLRFVAYFYAMNYALLKGMFKYLKGIQTNVWSPTQRNV